MNRYIALLRGINVGGHRVKMDVLRAHFSGLGHRDVWTFIASGNVGFSTDRADPTGLAQEIEARLERELGFGVATFIRTPEELGQLLSFDPPLPDDWDPEAGSHYVVFLDGPASPALMEALRGLESETDRFFEDRREVHWVTRGKLSESPLFGTGIDRATRGVRTTTRNITSLRRLAAKAGDEAERPA